jgi:hypothetical protein
MWKLLSILPQNFLSNAWSSSTIVTKDVSTCLNGSKINHINRIFFCSHNIPNYAYERYVRKNTCQIKKALVLTADKICVDCRWHYNTHTHTHTSSKAGKITHMLYGLFFLIFSCPFEFWFNLLGGGG